MECDAADPCAAMTHVDKVSRLGRGFVGVRGMRVMRLMAIVISLGVVGPHLNRQGQGYRGSRR